MVAAAGQLVEQIATTDRVKLVMVADKGETPPVLVGGCHESCERRCASMPASSTSTVVPNGSR